MGGWANQWVISWLKDRERQCPSHIYHYRAEPADLEEKTQDRSCSPPDACALTSGITRQSHTLASSPPFWEVTSTAPRCSSMLPPGVPSPCGMILPGPRVDSGRSDPPHGAASGETY